MLPFTVISCRRCMNLVYLTCFLISSIFRRLKEPVINSLHTNVRVHSNFQFLLEIFLQTILWICNYLFKAFFAYKKLNYSRLLFFVLRRNRIEDSLSIDYLLTFSRIASLLNYLLLNYSEILGSYLQEPHQQHVFIAHFEAEPHSQAKAKKLQRNV